MSPALTGRFFTTEPPGKPHTNLSLNFVSIPSLLWDHGQWQSSLAREAKTAWRCWEDESREHGTRPSVTLGTQHSTHACVPLGPCEFQVPRLQLPVQLALRMSTLPQTSASPSLEAVRGLSPNSETQWAVAWSFPEKRLLWGAQLLQKNPMCFLSPSGPAVLIRKTACVNAWLFFSFFSFLISQKSSFDQHHETMCKDVLRICRRFCLLWRQLLHPRWVSEHFVLCCQCPDGPDHRCLPWERLSYFRLPPKSLSNEFVQNRKGRA